MKLGATQIDPNLALTLCHKNTYLNGALIDELPLLTTAAASLLENELRSALGRFLVNVQHQLRQSVNDKTIIVKFELLVHGTDWLPSDDVPASRVPAFDIQRVSRLGHDSGLRVEFPELTLATALLVQNQVAAITAPDFRLSQIENIRAIDAFDDVPTHLLYLCLRFFL